MTPILTQDSFTLPQTQKTTTSYTGSARNPQVQAANPYGQPTSTRRSIQINLSRFSALKMESVGSTLHLSDQFVISCGTVTLDVQKSKVLLIRWRKTGEVFLPKGRKDINEGLPNTALRETFEETGVQARLMHAPINTLATTPSSQDQRSVLNTEPIAVSQRMHNGILKIIFWYVGRADSTIPPVKGTQQEGEEFDAIWEDYDDVESTISFVDDLRVVRAAIDAVDRLLKMAPWERMPGYASGYK